MAVWELARTLGVAEDPYEWLDERNNMLAIPVNGQKEWPSDDVMRVHIQQCPNKAKKTRLVYEWMNVPSGARKETIEEGENEWNKKTYKYE